METIPVTNNTDARQFEVRQAEEVAILKYEALADRIVFLHTQVPSSMEGKGIGSALAKAGLEYAQSNGLGVVPLCPFVRGYLQRHPEYQGLIRDSRTSN